MIVTPERVKAYAHCLNPACPGYGQQQLDVTRTTIGYGFKDNGGDLPGIERSTVTLEFADPADQPCRTCSRPRELSEHPRPSYQPISGYDPMGLVNGSVPQSFDPNRVNTEADARVAALEATVAKMAAALEAREAT